MTEDRVRRRLAAVLSADAVGFSRLTSDDEVATARLLRSHRALLCACVEDQGGRVVDAVGDNLLAEFQSVVDAASCAVEMQAELARRNREVSPKHRMPFRIGINLGDVLVEGERIVGEGVNVAARLEAKAPPGGVLLSGSAWEQVRGKVDVSAVDLGEQRLKNIPRPVRAFALELPGVEIPRPLPAGDALPAPRTSFVGRDRALNQLEPLLADARVLCLTGLGGAGKTRLALRLAERAAAGFEEVILAKLAPLRDEQQVAPAVLQAFGSTGGGGAMGSAASPEERLAGLIGHRRLLLVLDNCEHLISGVADAAREAMAAGREIDPDRAARSELAVLRA